MYSQITTKELENLVHQHLEIELIDVREKNEWDQVRIPGAKLIPLSSIEFRINDIDFSKPVYVFCRTGGRSGQVCGWLEWQWKKATNIIWSIKQLYEDQSDIIEITDKFVPSYLS
jgi:rhodanese-related sulfurtransferase